MKLIYSLLLGIALLGACKKVEVKIPDFEVTVEKDTYKVGEEVKFNFSGEANQISFYSGEPLHDYLYHEGRFLETLGLSASFKTNLFYNNQPNMFSVWLSTDYNGGNTYDDLSNATWKNDISQQFGIAPEDNPWGNPNEFPSGVVDLINATEKGKPLYVGFKYANNPANGVARNWYLYQFKLDAITLFGSENLIASLKGFTLVYDNNFSSESFKTSSISASGSTITFTTPAAIRPLNTEIWAVSPPIYLKKTDLGPDRPTSIKGFRNPMIVDYTHKYDEAGVYTVTFVAFNSNVNGVKEIVKQVTVTITD